METGTPTLSFKVGPPSIAEINGKRNCLAQDAPKGRVATSVETSLSLGDNQKTLVVSLKLGIKGIADADKSEAFVVDCIGECKYEFETPRQKAELEDPGFTRMLCEPLYHRIAVQLQDLVWKMGYNAVRVPLMYPLDRDPSGDTPPVRKPSTKRPRTAKRKAQDTLRPT